MIVPSRAKALLGAGGLAMAFRAPNSAMALTAADFAPAGCAPANAPEKIVAEHASGESVPPCAPATSAEWHASARNVPLLVVEAQGVAWGASAPDAPKIAKGKTAESGATAPTAGLGPIPWSTRW
jgi:hypothetical protein